MEKKIMRMFFLGCMLLSTVAAAAEQDDRWYVSPWVGYVDADVEQVVRHSVAYGVRAGKQANENWNLELALSMNKLKPQNSDDAFKTTALGADALYFFSRNPTFATFAVLGAGMQRTVFGADNGSSFMFNVGLGGQTSLGKNGAALRFDLRYRVDNNDTKIQNGTAFNDWVFMMGLTIPLGEHAAPATAPKP